MVHFQNFKKQNLKTVRQLQGQEIQDKSLHWTDYLFTHQ